MNRYFSSAHRVAVGYSDERAEALRVYALHLRHVAPLQANPAERQTVEALASEYERMAQLASVARSETAGRN